MAWLIQIVKWIAPLAIHDIVNWYLERKAKKDEAKPSQETK